MKELPAKPDNAEEAVLARWAAAQGTAERARILRNEGARCAPAGNRRDQEVYANGDLKLAHEGSIARESQPREALNLFTWRIVRTRRQPAGAVGRSRWTQS